MWKDQKLIEPMIMLASGVGLYCSYCLFTSYRRYRRYRSCASSLNNKTVRLVSDPYTCEEAVYTLREKCGQYKVLGLDCEWVPSFIKGQPENPVALLQLATKDGYCVLIRLCKFPNSIPRQLEILLADRSFLKVGVAICKDASKLMDEYGLSVNGWLDLRHLVVQNGGVPRGLENLANTVLGVKLGKNFGTQCGNWDTEILFEGQVDYAANDALVAVKIFDVLSKGYLTLPGFFTWLLNISNNEPNWGKCYNWMNVKFKN